jgi:hypothetical protein
MDDDQLAHLRLETTKLMVSIYLHSEDFPNPKDIIASAAEMAEFIINGTVPQADGQAKDD